MVDCALFDPHFPRERVLPEVERSDDPLQLSLGAPLAVASVGEIDTDGFPLVLDGCRARGGARAGHLRHEGVAQEGDRPGGIGLEMLGPRLDADAARVADRSQAPEERGVVVFVAGEREDATVRVKSAIRKPKDVSATSLKVELAKEDTAAAGEVEIVVINADGTLSNSAKLIVS